jgi:hypothetical protein
MAPAGGPQPAAAPGAARTLAATALRRAAGAGRDHPLEVTCLTLMLIGGLAYPVPVWWADFAVWLIGAGIATMSRTWDLRDKWSGLVGPMALVVVGTVAAVALGGSHHSAAGYFHEASTGLLYLTKAATLMGAAFLAWRVHRGPRSPAVPPWRRDRRV